MRGDYMLVSTPTKGLAALLRGEQPRSSTGKILTGSNARRRLQSRRNCIVGQTVATYTFWKATTLGSREFTADDLRAIAESCTTIE